MVPATVMPCSCASRMGPTASADQLDGPSTAGTATASAVAVTASTAAGVAAAGAPVAPAGSSHKRYPVCASAGVAMPRDIHFARARAPHQLVAADIAGRLAYTGRPARIGPRPCAAQWVVTGPGTQGARIELGRRIRDRTPRGDSLVEVGHRVRHRLRRQDRAVGGPVALGHRLRRIGHRPLAR